jgi:hypothetical protein
VKTGVRSPLVQEDEVIVHDGVCKRKGLKHHTISSADKPSFAALLAVLVIPLTGHHHPGKCEHQRRATHVPAAATDALILGRMQWGAPTGTGRAMLRETLDAHQGSWAAHNLALCIVLRSVARALELVLILHAHPKPQPKLQDLAEL